MGFEELGDGGLVDWLAGWIMNVAGTVDFAAAGESEAARKITASIQGDLVRLELTEAAPGMTPDRLSRAIERGYVDAYREAQRQAGMIFDRIEQDTAANPAVLPRIRKIREEHSGRDGLRRMLRRQRVEQESAWDPVADPLRRRI